MPSCEHDTGLGVRKWIPGLEKHLVQIWASCRLTPKIWGGRQAGLQNASVETDSFGSLGGFLSTGQGNVYQCMFSHTPQTCMHLGFGLSVGAAFGPHSVFQPRIKRDNQMMKIKQMWKKPKQNNKVRAGWSSCCLKPQSAQTNKTHNKTKQIHFTAWGRSGFKLSQHLGTLHFSCCAEAASLPAVFVRAFRGRAVFLLWLCHATDHEAAL